MKIPDWLHRCMVVWPHPRWSQEKCEAYIEAMRDAKIDDTIAMRAVRYLVAGGHKGDFAPPVNDLVRVAVQYRREEHHRRQQDADQALRQQERANIAPPWHARLWCAVWWRLQQIDPPEQLGLQPYLEIVDRYNLTPEDAGVVWVKNGGYLTTDMTCVMPDVHRAQRDAEAVWRGSGIEETPEQAAAAMLAGMVPATT